LRTFADRDARRAHFAVARLGCEQVKLFVRRILESVYIGVMAGGAGRSRRNGRTGVQVVRSPGVVERGSVVGLKAWGWVMLANIVAPLIGVGAFILLHSF
jgi:hypothetical protein